MSNSESDADTSTFTVNPYATTDAAPERSLEGLSWSGRAIVGILSVLSLVILLTVLDLLVTIVYDMQPFAREANHLIIAGLLTGGVVMSVAISFLAGLHSFRRTQKIIMTLSAPTPARVRLTQQVAAILKDRSSH
ncbi:MAG: hypothetical protein P8J37_08830 [Fuerstiella sp.]|nr:hypothetical protein [Fuerstiella sp.]